MTAGQPIVPQIEAWASAQKITLAEGWKVDVAREAKRRALVSNFPGFDTSTLDLWTKIFSDLLDDG